MSARRRRATMRDMLDFTLETHIDRPATDVFDLISDPAQLHTWQTNTVSSVPDGPMGVGTRLREVHRGPGGKEFASVVEVTEYEPGAVFALRVIEGTPVHLRVTLSAGTDVAFRVHGELRGVKRLLLQPVLKRQFARQLATLKSVLEAGDHRPSSRAAFSLSTSGRTSSRMSS